MTGYMFLDSWAGRTKHPVRVLKETPKRYKVELLEDCMKGKTGKVIYIPKYAFKAKEG